MVAEGLQPLCVGSGGLAEQTRAGEGEVLLFQAIFAALGLCCLGGKGVDGGFVWLPHAEPVELSVH